MPSIETQVDGLRRTFRVVIPVADLRAEVDAKIAEAAPRLQLKGFRTGKVPVSHVRKVYGAAIFRDVVNEQVEKSTKETVGELRVASEPTFELESDLDQVEKGAADLAFKVAVDLMPEFDPIDVATIEIEKPVAPVADEQIDETLAEIAKANRRFDAKEGPAADGDALTIDFLGKIDGEAFDGGAAENANIVIGDKRFIPGFEEQLVGLSKDDAQTISVTFPDDYPVEDLKGKPATFDVTVKDVRAPVEIAIDDALATSMGFPDLAALRTAVSERLGQDLAALSRQKAKRALFDQLDAAHTFELPTAMVEAEFAGIWGQIEKDREAGQLDSDDADKSEDELRAEYRRIAERRVRLGLVLAEIGRRGNVEVRNEELVAAIQAEARRFPGRERDVVTFYQQNPGAVAQIRAPLYEEKVVDFILELAKVTQKTVTREELTAD
ncbi:MAG: trigger factor [Caulobacterales bacterium]|jgi:trigger factor